MKSTKKHKKTKNGSKKSKNLLNFIALYFTTKRAKLLTIGSLFVGIIIGLLAGFIVQNLSLKEPIKEVEVNKHWLMLHRKSNVELIYKGKPGDEKKSTLVRSFQVKTGMEGRPTPLPQLYGREYWVITKKYATTENIETAPYFIELNIPHENETPFGPSPYLECNGQCNWELPGPFGLHGVNSDNSRLSLDNPGSSGCIRHTDSDITFLYNIINTREQVRYYIQDK